MMKKSLTLVLMIYAASISAQFNKQMQGVWITSNAYSMNLRNFGDYGNHIINDSLSYDGMKVALNKDDLIFSSPTWFGENFPYVEYHFRILKLTDTLLVLKPVTSQTQKAYCKSDTLFFMRQKYIHTSHLHFCSVQFNSGGCFGSCPVYSMQIDSTAEIRLCKKMAFVSGQWDSITGGRKIDSGQLGYFKGKLNNSEYGQLISLLAQLNPDSTYFPPTFCCDLPRRTIILYYNGKRKRMSSLWPPNEAKPLIDFLSGLYIHTSLEKTNERWDMEE
jgi:hypothetical protein